MIGRLHATDLKDCPFCSRQPFMENTVTEVAIICADCKVTITVRHAPKSDATGIREVKRLWNRRAPARGLE
jgi:hypothetical protein